MATKKQTQPKAAAPAEIDEAKAEEFRRDLPPGIECEMREAPPVQLYMAMLKVQSEVRPVRKNGENSHFKSRYATLDEIWESVRDAVNRNGLLVSSIPREVDGRWKIVTHIIHAATGQMIVGEFPLKADPGSPQPTGSSMTYGRRYTICAMLQIVTGDGLDDDGEAATVHDSPNPSATKVADALGF